MLVFHFSMYHQSSLKPIYQHMSLRPYERIDCWDLCTGRQNSMAAGHSSSTALSRPRANFLHQTRTDGLIKHLPPDTGCTSRVNGICTKSFARRKRITEVTERCGLWDAFNGNVFINDVTV